MAGRIIKCVSLLDIPGLSIARGMMENVDFVHKFGRNPDVDSGGGFEAIWNGGGDYTGHNAIVAETLEVFSSSDNDVGSLLSSGTATGGSGTTLEDDDATFVSDGGAIGDVVINDTRVSHGHITAITETKITVLQMDEEEDNEEGDAYRLVTEASAGAGIVELYNLLDNDFIQQPNEYVILNGTTPVDTIGQYIRADRAHCHSGSNNVGTITVRQKTTTANVMIVMPTGYSATMLAAFTVPAGKRAYITSWFAGLAGKTQADCNIRLLVSAVNDAPQVKEEFAISGAGNSYVQRDYIVPKNNIAQRSDIKIMADSDAVNTAIAAGFDLVLVGEGKSG
ncbi:hypothetical protein KAR91_11725 [Candidatus Pacearchaeota archaeon]|nr:hypothetical protein [Candidatus Pacearchaeota archaeon]